MVNWFKIDREEIRKNVFEKNAALSPFEIPDAIGISFNKEKKLLIIEFKYIDDEAPLKFDKDGVRGLLGKHTGRLLKLELDLPENFKCKKFKIDICNADEKLNSIESIKHTSWQRNNFNAIKKIIRNNSETFSKQVPCY